MNWSSHQLLNDKGKGVKKKLANGSINPAWLKIHRPHAWQRKYGKKYRGFYATGAVNPKSLSDIL